MKHVLLVDLSLNGREYGALRSLEAEIVNQTGALIIEIPQIHYPLEKLKMNQSMRLASVRKLIPKKRFQINADVIWCVLMGPENYKLDIFKEWNLVAKYRVVYLFDTFRHQLQCISRLFSNNIFNIKITSFNDAIPMLEEATGYKWHHIEQGADPVIFKPLQISERKIAFSSYGRKDLKMHENIKLFCKKKNLYYDFTTEINAVPIVDAQELYQQYAWHLCQSIFTISWAVEKTNPSRAKDLRPITCRWFEAAVSNTILLGQKPDNVHFDNYFPPNFVLPLNSENSAEDLQIKLEFIWENRFQLYDEKLLVFNKQMHRWTWQSRVDEIIIIINNLAHTQ